MNSGGLNVHNRTICVRSRFALDPAVSSSDSATWPLRRWIKQLAGCLRMGLLTTNDHACSRMNMRKSNTLNSACAGQWVGGDRVVEWHQGQAPGSSVCTERGCGLNQGSVVAALYCSTTLAGMRPRSLTAMPWVFAHDRISLLR